LARVKGEKLSLFLQAMIFTAETLADTPVGI